MSRQTTAPRLEVYARRTADYVIIITGRAYKATFMGHDIFLATKFELLPVNSNIIPSHHPSEHYLTTLLESHLNSGTFWFSYDWDLTRRLQAQGDDEGKALWEAVRFIFALIPGISIDTYRLG